MAKPRRAHLFVPSRQLGCLAIALHLFLGVGCQNPPKTNPSGSPTAAATSNASSSPAVVATPISDTEIISLYQAPTEPTQNGWTDLKPFFGGSEDSAALDMETVGELDLDKPAHVAVFDEKVVPFLQAAFSKPAFTASAALLSGQDPINFHYRDLRTLCDMLTKRADQLWDGQQKDKALPLIELPLRLAHALQSRPETVSVNDFSSKYASSSLATIADWASTNSLTQPELDTLIANLASYRPDYDHLVLSISVDFAQLENSLSNQEVRTGILGLGLSRPEEIEGWKKQLQGLRPEAQKLYGLHPIDPKAFNDAILKLAPPIQGIVIDYPNVAAMQKRSFASYLATELALVLEKHRISKTKKPLTSEEAFAQAFGANSKAEQVAKALLEVRLGATPSQFTVAGRTGMFALVTPDPNVVFYERNSAETP